jgi:hypothetical protein
MSGDLKYLLRFPLSSLLWWTAFVGMCCALFRMPGWPLLGLAGLIVLKGWLDARWHDLRKLGSEPFFEGK